MKNFCVKFMYMGCVCYDHELAMGVSAWMWIKLIMLI